MSNTAIIILAVTTFVANPSPVPVEPFCEITQPSFEPGPGRSGPSNASGQVEIVADGTIVVTRRNPAQAPIKLEFGSGSGVDYDAVDMVFVQDRGSEDPDGSLNFRNRGKNGKKFTVEDHWITRGKRNNPDGSNQAPNWKYYLRVKVGDQFGWIDPGIENSDEN
ncbi:MAG: hypothetical protein Q8J74_10100 [Candidatus Didemnitutus sp.]|nr:hypothetical protein [Candidatus Didemnitutus sp.]